MPRSELPPSTPSSRMSDPDATPSSQTPLMLAVTTPASAGFATSTKPAQTIPDNTKRLIKTASNQHFRYLELILVHGPCPPRFTGIHQHWDDGVHRCAADREC